MFKEEVTQYCKNCYELTEQLDQLKSENEELREQLELNTANAVVIDMAQRLYKLKQALQEIKELAEAITNGTHFSDDIEAHLKEMVNKILEKISEVEDE